VCVSACVGHKCKRYAHTPQIFIRLFFSVCNKRGFMGLHRKNYTTPDERAIVIALYTAAVRTRTYTIAGSCRGSPDRQGRFIRDLCCVRRHHHRSECSTHIYRYVPRFSDTQQQHTGRPMRGAHNNIMIHNNNIQMHFFPSTMAALHVPTIQTFVIS